MELSGLGKTRKRLAEASRGEIVLPEAALEKSNRYQIYRLNKRVLAGQLLAAIDELKLDCTGILAVSSFGDGVLEYVDLNRFQVFLSGENPTCRRLAIFDDYRRGPGNIREEWIRLYRPAYIISLFDEGPESRAYFKAKGIVLAHVFSSDFTNWLPLLTSFK
jgi:hypothetical protein